MPYETLLSRIADRLEAMGLSERKACLRAGLGVDAIRQLKRGHAPKAETLSRLAKILEVPPSHFLELADPSAPSEAEAVPGPRLPTQGDLDVPPGYAAIPMLRVHPGMGGFGNGADDDLGPPQLVPTSLIEGELRGQPLDFLMMEVDGPSMEPVLFSGDRVIVDRRRLNPSQPAVFCLYDGFGITVKWVERVPHSEPPKFLLSSENARFKAYEVLADEARLIGRVVWFARRM